ncbi:MAG: TerD family protein [Clostridia bacterium]|nr:TerD family protein [Clostridia bacterium]
MAETKLLKAHCSTYNKYYGILVEKIGAKYKAVDFIPLDEEEAKLVSSPTDLGQTTFETNDNLLPCNWCKTRTVCSCGCAKGSKCSSTMGYRFQCIYCNNLKIDYTKPRPIDGKKAGETIQLSQGQVVKIAFADDTPLTKIKIGVGWDPVESGDQMDIDSSVVVVGSNSMHELVYYGDLEHKSGCVKHHGDNITGKGQGDDENISINLSKVPSNRNKLIFIINIYRCDCRNQNLKDVRNMYIYMSDPNSGTKLMEYKINKQDGNYTSVVLGVAFRDGDGWSFKAIGQGRYDTDVRSMANEVAGKTF